MTYLLLALSTPSGLSRNALVPLVVPSQAHKLRKLLVFKSIEAPLTCRAGALLTECRRRTSVVPATVPCS